jgi:hypothetical protein
MSIHPTLRPAGLGISRVPATTGIGKVLALAVVLALAIPRTGEAQRPVPDGISMDQACLHVVATVESSASAFDAAPLGQFELIGADLDTLLASVESMKAIGQRVRSDSLWITYRPAFESQLSDRVADAYKYGIGYARAAAGIYHEVSARPGPMLAALLEGNSETRRSIGLAAINGPLTADESAVVLRFACDAAWALGALRDDERYARMALYGPELQWPIESKRTLMEAYRLLDGKPRQLVALALAAPWMETLRDPE